MQKTRTGKFWSPHVQKMLCMPRVFLKYVCFGHVCVQERNLTAQKALADIVFFCLHGVVSENLELQIELQDSTYGIPISEEHVELEGFAQLGLGSLLPPCFRHLNLSEDMLLSDFLKKWSGQDNLWSVCLSAGIACEAGLSMQPEGDRLTADVLQAAMPVPRGPKRAKRLDPELVRELGRTQPEEFQRLKRTLNIKKHFLRRGHLRDRSLNQRMNQYVRGCRDMVSKLQSAPSLWVATDAGTVGQEETLFSLGQVYGDERTAWLVPQHMRSLPVAGDLADQPVEQQVALWQERLDQFFEPVHAKSGGKKATVVKRRDRLCALDWMKSLDNSLAVSFGVRLKHFMPDAQDAQSPSEPRKNNVLTLVMDEGSVGWAAFWFMSGHLNLRVVGRRDPLHRASNDWKNAVKASALWKVVTRTCLVWNLAHGPWGSGRFHERACEASHLLSNRMDSNDPLFQWMLGQISLMYLNFRTPLVYPIVKAYLLLQGFP